MQRPFELIIVILFTLLAPSVSADDKLNLKLIGATTLGDVRLVKKYVEQGADVNTRLDKGKSALHWAARSSPPEAVKILIDAGAKVNVKDDSGLFPLQFALWGGRSGSVQLLIDAGADVKRELPGGASSLHFAVLHADGVATKALLKAGAPTDLKTDAFGTKDQLTPVELAVEYINPSALVPLLEADAKIKPSDLGVTPLHLAAVQGTSAAIKKLLEGGAKLDAKDKQGTTPVIYAAAAGNQATLKTLLDAGADRHSILGAAGDNNAAKKRLLKAISSTVKEVKVGTTFGKATWNKVKMNQHRERFGAIRFTVPEGKNLEMGWAYGPDPFGDLNVTAWASSVSRIQSRSGFVVGR